MGGQAASGNVTARERRLARALRLIEARLGPEVAQRLAVPRKRPE